MTQVCILEVPKDEGLKALGVDEGVWMGWEIENQITADFVDVVRKGSGSSS